MLYRNQCFRDEQVFTYCFLILITDITEYSERHNKSDLLCCQIMIYLLWRRFSKEAILEMVLHGKIHAAEQL